MIRYPALIVNFKTYQQATGQHAIDLASKLADVREQTNAEVIAVPQPYRLTMISQLIPSFSQHIDPVKYGSNTGHILPEAAQEAGAVGTLLNHSEHRLEHPALQKSIERAKQAGLMVCACAKDAEEAGKIAAFKPDMIAVEPPELIGSGVSVSKAKPEVISKSVEAVKSVDPEIHVLCGAGVSTAEDVAKALELGAEGVLVASAVVCADDQQKVALEMAKALGGEK